MSELTPAELTQQINAKRQAYASGIHGGWDVGKQTGDTEMAQVLAQRPVGAAVQTALQTSHPEWVQSQLDDVQRRMRLSFTASQVNTPYKKGWESNQFAAEEGDYGVTDQDKTLVGGGFTNENRWLNNPYSTLPSETQAEYARITDAMAQPDATPEQISSLVAQWEQLDETTSGHRKRHSNEIAQQRNDRFENSLVRLEDPEFGSMFWGTVAEGVEETATSPARFVVGSTVYGATDLGLSVNNLARWAGGYPTIDSTVRREDLSTAVSIGSGIVQFVIPFGVAGKLPLAAKAGTWLTGTKTIQTAARYLPIRGADPAAKVGSYVAKSVVNGTIADFVAFDPSLGNFSTMMRSLGYEDNAILSMLDAKMMTEENGQVAGRLAQVVEGIMLGGVADAALGKVGAGLGKMKPKAASIADATRFVSSMIGVDSETIIKNLPKGIANTLVDSETARSMGELVEYGARKSAYAAELSVGVKANGEKYTATEIAAMSANKFPAAQFVRGVERVHTAMIMQSFGVDAQTAKDLVRVTGSDQMRSLFIGGEKLAPEAFAEMMDTARFLNETRGSGKIPISSASKKTIDAGVGSLTTDQLKKHFSLDTTTRGKKLYESVFGVGGTNSFHSTADIEKLRARMSIELQENHRAAKASNKQHAKLRDVEAGSIVVGKDGKITVASATQPYMFNIGKDGNPLVRGTPEYAQRQKQIATYFADQIKAVEAKAAAGDPASKAIIAQRGWYKRIRATMSTLTTPEIATDWANIYAAFSANTTWAVNEKFALEFLPEFMRGNYDTQLSAWKSFRESQTAWDKSVESNAKNMTIKQANEATTKSLGARPVANQSMYIKSPRGTLYGMNSEPAMDAITGLWEIKAGGAPKIKSFAASLGKGNRAVIDLWMGRAGEMATGNKQPLPSLEQGVSGVFEKDASGAMTTSGAFGLSSDATEDAARTLGWMNADGTPDIKGLQASLWFFVKNDYVTSGLDKMALGGTPRISGMSVAGDAGQYRIVAAGRITDTTTGTTRLPSAGEHEARSMRLNTLSPDMDLALASRAEVLREAAEKLGDARRSGLMSGSREQGIFGIVFRRIGDDESTIGSAYKPSVFQKRELEEGISIASGSKPILNEPYVDFEFADSIPTNDPTAVAISNRLQDFYVSPNFVQAANGDMLVGSLGVHYVPDIDPVVMDAIQKNPNITQIDLEKVIATRREEFKKVTQDLANEFGVQVQRGNAEVMVLSSGDIDEYAAMPRADRDTLIDTNIATPKLFAPFTGQEGFSYSPTSMSPPKRKGYMVAIGDEKGTKLHQTAELKHMPTEAELASFMAANADALKNNDRLFVGGWMETKDKLDAAGAVVLGADGKPVQVFVKYWLDISELVDDLATAKQLGYNRGQIAILDTESFNTINTQKAPTPNGTKTSSLPTGTVPSTTAGAGTGTSSGSGVRAREAELPASERIIARRANYTNPINTEDAGAATTKKWMDSRDPLKPTSTGRNNVQFEGGSEVPYGVHVSDGRASFIRGMTDPDAVTAAHEIGHSVRVMHVNKSAPMSNRVLTDEMIDAIEQDFGVVNGEWTSEAEERFSEAFVSVLSKPSGATAPFNAETLKASKRLGAVLRDTYQQTRGDIVDVNPETAARMELLIARQDLPIQYAAGKWMDQIDFTELVTAIKDSQTRGDNDWLRLIAPDDVLGTARMHSFPNDGATHIIDPITGSPVPVTAGTEGTHVIDPATGLAEPISRKDAAFASTGGEARIRNDLRFFTSDDDALRFFAYFDQLAKRMEEDAGLRDSSAMKLLKKDGLAIFGSYMMAHGDNMSSAMEAMWQESVRGGVGASADNIPRFVVTLQLAVRSKLEQAQSLAKNAMKTDNPIDYMEMQKVFLDLQKLRFQILRSKRAAGRFLKSWDPAFTPTRAEANDAVSMTKEAEEWLKERGLDQMTGKTLAETLSRLDLHTDTERALRMLDAPSGPKAWAVRGKQIMTDIMINGMLSAPRTFLTLQAISTPIMLAAEGVQKITGALISGDVATAALTVRNIPIIAREMLDSLRIGATSAIKENPVLLDNRMGQTEDWFPQDSENMIGNVAAYSLHRGISIPSAIIGGVDEVWKQATARTYILEQAYRKEMTRRASDAGITGWFANAKFIAENNRAVGEESQRVLDEMITDGKLLNAQRAYDQIMKDPIVVAEQDPVRKSSLIMDRMSDLWTPERRTMAEGAERAAREATYTEQLHGWTRSVGAASNKHFVLKMILPFWKVPVNIYRRMAGYALSPVMFGGDLAANLAKGKVGFNPDSRLYAMHRRTQMDMLSGDPSKVARAKGQVGMGAAMLYGGWELYQSEKISGSGPTDPEQRRLLTQTGWQPYSIRIGDTWHPYKKIEPFGSLLGIITDYHELADGSYMQNEEDQVTAVTAAIYAFASASVNKSYMQGMSDLIDALHDPDKMEGWLSRQSTSFMPYSNLQRGIVKGQDANSYDIRAGIEESDAFLGEFKELVSRDYARMSVFGDRTGIVKHYNFMGEPVTTYDPLDGSVYSSMVFQLGSPVQSSPIRDDPVISALTSVRGSVWRPVGKMREGVDLTEIHLPEHEATAYDYYNDRISTIRGPVNTNKGKRMLTLRETLTGMINGQVPELAAAWTGAQRGDELVGNMELRRKIVGDIIGKFREAAWAEVAPSIDENGVSSREGGSPTLSHAMRVRGQQRLNSANKAAEATKQKRAELQKALEATNK